jgi:hypothetical protein
MFRLELAQLMPMRAIEILRLDGMKPKRSSSSSNVFAAGADLPGTRRYGFSISSNNLFFRGG